VFYWRIKSRVELKKATKFNECQIRGSGVCKTWFGARQIIGRVVGFLRRSRSTRRNIQKLTLKHWYQKPRGFSTKADQWCAKNARRRFFRFNYLIIKATWLRATRWNLRNFAMGNNQRAGYCNGCYWLDAYLGHRLQDWIYGRVVFIKSRQILAQIIADRDEQFRLFKLSNW
jgi:hypothetical protein